MASAAIVLSRTFESIVCYDCSIEFAVESHVKSRWIESEERWFYCPNGHKQHYTETEVQRLTKELEREKRSRESAERTAEWERKRRIKIERKHKKEMRTIHVRVGNGVCPCCNRTFGNLQRHMNTKHPDYKSEVA